MAKVGFIGLGNMGLPIAGRVLAGGHDLAVHDLDRELAADLEHGGARWCESIGDVGSAADIVVLSLPGPRQIERVVLGAGGLLEHLAEGSIIVDLSTSSVESVRVIADAAEAVGVELLDAPVSGGSAGAQAGTLVVMVGGRSAAVEGARSVLETFGDPVLHLGETGAGTVMKLVNNQVFLAGEVVFQEGLVLAAKAGLDPAQAMAVLARSGAGGAHVANGARVVGRQFEGPGFALSLAEKDLALAIAAGRELGVPMPATAAAHETFIAALAAGYGDQRSFATLQAVEAAASTQVPEVSPDA